MTWNERGPAGVRGAKGAPGQAGAVAGYTATNDSDQGVSIPDDNEYHSVISKALPAGKYVVTYSVELYNSSATSTYGGCRINTPSNDSYVEYTLVATPQGAPSTTTEPSGTYGVVVPSGGATITVACTSENVPIGALNPTMSATQVSTLG